MSPMSASTPVLSMSMSCQSIKPCSSVLTLCSMAGNAGIVAVVLAFVVGGTTSFDAEEEKMIDVAVDDAGVTV